MLMSCKVNFHVVRSALQNSMCLVSITDGRGGGGGWLGIYPERKWSINKAAHRNYPFSLPCKVKDGNSLLTNRSWSFFLYSSNSRKLDIAQPRSRGSLLLVMSQERRTLGPGKIGGRLSEIAA